MGCALYDVEHWRAPSKRSEQIEGQGPGAGVDMIALATSDRFIYTYRLPPGVKDQRHRQKKPSFLLGKEGTYLPISPILPLKFGLTCLPTYPLCDKAAACTDTA